MAQRTEPGKEYVAAVITRLRECTDTATPYAESPITTDMVESKVIRMVCLNTIMAKLAEIYFEPNSFGEGGIRARIDELKTPLYAIYHGAHNGHWGCDGRYCGTAADSLFPRDNYVWFLLDLTEYMIDFSAEPGQLPDDWRVRWADAAKFKLSPPRDVR
ncbi:MAG: hypothetical protein L0Z53_12930 [Acidobacteriales bacterium]|nr:hypothetical protein [Terriglobales bacterium]